MNVHLYKGMQSFQESKYHLKTYILYILLPLTHKYIHLFTFAHILAYILLTVYTVKNMKNEQNGYFIAALLVYNSHNTIYQFKLYYLIVFIIFTELHNHHYEF